jgi:hypothetical protein
VYDGVNKLDESTAACHSPMDHRKERGEATPEDQGQQAMRAVVALIVGVLFVLIVAYFAIRGYDDEEQPRGHGWRILDALSYLLSWSSWWR